MEEKEGKKGQEAIKDPWENVRAEEKVRRFYDLSIYDHNSVSVLSSIKQRYFIFKNHDLIACILTILSSELKISKPPIIIFPQINKVKPK